MQPQYPAQYPAQPAYAPTYPQQYTQPAPAYPQQPAYPQAPAAYPQQYAQPQQYAAPAPQYAPPSAPPPPPLPTGSLDDFYQQPSTGGGPSWKFRDANAQPMIGKEYLGIVARPVTDADIRAQTDNSGRPMTYRDGRQKFVMVVPMQMQPSAEFPDGQAGWWVKGQARDELARAMAEAGAPVGPPEAGAGIWCKLVSIRPVPNMSPAYQYQIRYARPNGAAPVAPPAVQAPPAQPVQQAPAPVQMSVTAYPPQVPMPQPMQQPVAVAAPAAAPTGFDAEQAALFARLTGQQPAPAPQG